MLIPHYWAEGQQQGPIPNKKKPIQVRRYGWSNESQADAQRHADKRAQEAFSRIADGQPLARREMKLAYGSEGLPIREEVVAQEHNTVLTRNSYGALCLNTPNVVFADVDFEHSPPGWWGWAIGAVLMAIAIALRCNGGSVLAAVLAVLALGGGSWARMLHELKIVMGGGHERQALNRIRAFHRQHPHWHLRTYRTPKGLRVLVAHTTMDPDDADVGTFFEAVNADPLYVRMCQQQQCFRARVSPKPWRMGIAHRIRRWDGLPSGDKSRDQERRIWVKNYDRVAEGYSACHFLEALGPTDRMTTETAKVMSMHDTLSRSCEELPLA